MSAQNHDGSTIVTALPAGKGAACIVMKVHASPFLSVPTTPALWRRHPGSAPVRICPHDRHDLKQTAWCSKERYETLRNPITAWNARNGGLTYTALPPMRVCRCVPEYPHHVMVHHWLTQGVKGHAISALSTKLILPPLLGEVC